jgi:hypothetical protein
VVAARVDPDSGLLAAPGAPGIELSFRRGSEPTTRADAPGVPLDLSRASREF